MTKSIRDEHGNTVKPVVSYNMVLCYNDCLCLKRCSYVEGVIDCRVKCIMVNHSFSTPGPYHYGTNVGMLLRANGWHSFYLVIMLFHTIYGWAFLFTVSLFPSSNAMERFSILICLERWNVFTPNFILTTFLYALLLSLFIWFAFNIFTCM